MLKFTITVLLLLLIFSSTSAMPKKRQEGLQTRKGNLSGSSKRVQMRIYRGPDAGHNTQWGFFVRQPASD